MENVSKNNESTIKYCFLCEKPIPNRLARYRVMFKNGMIAYLCKWHFRKCKDNICHYEEINDNDPPGNPISPKNTYASIVETCNEIRYSKKKPNDRIEPDLTDNNEIKPEQPKHAPALLTIETPRLSFNELILSNDKKEQIDDALWLYSNSDQAYLEYGISPKITYGKAKTMLFYGLPGTGKTATAHAIADKLGKDIGIAAYDQIENCYIGNTEKNIVKVFEEARNLDCVLLFDEADSMFGKRLEESHSCDRHYNKVTNVLMQQIEAYEGLIILTTNRELALDSAFERRLLFKLGFGMPTREERVKTWGFFLRRCPRLNSNVSFDELGNYELTGGQIKNAVIKTVSRCAKENRNIDKLDLIQAIETEIERSAQKKRIIGF